MAVIKPDSFRVPKLDSCLPVTCLPELPPCVTRAGSFTSTACGIGTR